MLYKTIILELLQQHPQMHEQLRRQKILLKTMEFYAQELKARHQAWKEELQAIRPDSDEQIAGEAMELAVSEIEDRLSVDSEAETLDFLDGAMATLRPLPPA